MRRWWRKREAVRRWWRSSDERDIGVGGGGGLEERRGRERGVKNL